MRRADSAAQQGLFLVVVSCGFPAGQFADQRRRRAGKWAASQHAFLPAGNSGANLQIFMPSTRPLGRAARPVAAIVPAYFMENRAW
jgi:hypothetical protein